MKKVTGLSVVTEVTKASSAIFTQDQLGGKGVVYNQSLVIPGHLHQQRVPVESLEYVTLSPATEEVSCVGEHEQHTDEIYFLCTGAGVLSTNGMHERVRAGDLVIAPKGVRHAITNDGDVPLSFLVVEIRSPEAGRAPTVVRELSQQLALLPFHETSVPVRWVSHALQRYFSGPWGDFMLLELPPGGCVHPYVEDVDQHLLITTGNATLLIEQDRIGTDGFGLSAWVPQGVSCGIINQSKIAPLTVIRITVPREE